MIPEQLVGLLMLLADLRLQVGDQARRIAELEASVAEHSERANP